MISLFSVIIDQFHCYLQYQKYLNMLFLINCLNILHRLFCSEQFGFRPGHSTELASSRFMNHIVQQMDQHHTPISIFLDMSKAFDTLNQKILLRKLAYYSVKGSANKLLQSYPSERLQYVEFERQISDKLPITTGLPQGSILGPLLFLIYINGLPSVSNFFKMIMYADDTTLYCNINETTMEGIINTELSHVNVWLNAKKISLNVAKTKFMVFHTPNKIVNYPKLK